LDERSRRRIDEMGLDADDGGVGKEKFSRRHDAPAIPLMSPPMHS
jgi:hypothetical protein